MDRDPLNDNQSQYDVFKQDPTIGLEVAEAKPLEGNVEDIPKNEQPRRHFKFKKRFLIIILVTLIILGATVAIAKLFNKPVDKPGATVVVNTQSLDNGTLNQLTPKNNGEVRQQLTISPDTIFKNNVTVQGSADVNNNLSIGGTLNVQSAANFRDSLNVGNNLTVNGLITAASLSVGSITLSSINISGNLVFGGHIVPTGSEPSVRPSAAAAGGTVSVSGNDTAGTITITTGNGGLLAGEMAIITFRTAFGGTPKVQLTPLNAAASGLRYYASHSAGFFTINTSIAPAAGTVYIFDYLVTQ